MSTNKNIERICVVCVIAALVMTVLFMNGELLGIEKTQSAAGYEARLFNTEKVHTLDIVIDDWDSFIETCQSEEYSVCDVVIDGEAFGNVAIRGKGNTSLSNVASMDSDRYSFKIEFDHYNSGSTYYGLDKLSLNNIIQDNTYMKDYLTYRLMGEFGANAPLCSYVYISVNGEEWGLYLAVEGIEDAFLMRNFGSNYGELYKPDSMSFGGGRGNGKDFDINALISDGDEDSSAMQSQPEAGSMPENFDPSQLGGEIPQKPEDFDFSQPGAEMPENFDPSESFGKNETGEAAQDFGGRGMGSSDVKLQYIDDNPESYQNIFDNAKTDITDADKTRLIESLKTLSEYENLEEVVDIEQVIRYFVVHNYVCNGDSYTGSMIHNYYLYEKDGKMSMIPWDYNLAFGTFQSSDATSTVNSPIDTPVSGSNMDDRPMVNWIFSDEGYTDMYHKLFGEFMESVDIQSVISKAEEIIAPYVEKDPTKFCTYEEFTKGVSTLKEFCSLRSESVKGQLEGKIPSTSDAQSADSSALVDASSITISDMGTMGMGGGFGGKNDRPGDSFGKGNEENTEDSTQSDGTEESTTQPQMPEMPQQGEFPQGGQMPPEGDFPQDGNMPTPPEGMPQRGERPGMKNPSQ